MKTRRSIGIGVAGLAIAALCLFPGCTRRPSAGDPGKAAALAPEEQARAFAVYDDLGCGLCHGELGEGQAEIAPPLRDLAPYWTAERLSTYILNPDYFRRQNPDFDERRAAEYDNVMPSYEEASEEDLELLGRWLMTR